MNREIKFRAWNPSLKSWIVFPTWNEAQEANGNSYSTTLELSDLKGFCLWSQFTGLKDTNRKEIYEGDIIYNSFADRKQNGVVQWSNIHHGYIICYPYEKPSRQWHQMHGQEHCYKVIGNIYENPELLTP